MITITPGAWCLIGALVIVVELYVLYRFFTNRDPEPPSNSGGHP